jgi:5'-methylthioadenosine/S-adenosylhomocysteine nucleosidase
LSIPGKSDEEPVHTAIIGAMDQEIAECLRHGILLGEDKWAGFTIHHLRLCGRRCVLVRCGVGKVFAAFVCQHLIDTYRPSQVVFTGVAGSLNPDLDIGDVVVGRDLLQHDVDGRALGFALGQLIYTDRIAFPADPELLRKAMAATLGGSRLHSGRILTGDQFMTRADIEKHGHLAGELAGDVVEMEGAALAQVCSFNGIPCLVVRTVTDKADGGAVGDFNAFLPIVAKNSFSVLHSVLTHD